LFWFSGIKLFGNIIIYNFNEIIDPRQFCAIYRRPRIGVHPYIGANLVQRGTAIGKDG